MVKTRFAPSPTGFLHIGSVRTALYSWLFARQQGGQFVLRIEDTDQSRSTQDSIDTILQGMAWLGMDYDDGPIYQMDRLERYHALANELIEEGNAYRCSCSKERLESLREQQLAAKEKPRYDGYCRELSINADVPHVVRFRNPEQGSVGFEDLVYGLISVENSELDDLIMIRTDGVPTYNFSVVVDDWDMGISHVIRGDDHINNTPRQVNLLKALDAPIPIYAHLPMILGKDGKKMSKRHGAVNLMNYKDEGFLQVGLLNYLARLGWSHGDQELFNLEELIELFSFKHVHRGGATYDMDKLNWTNQQHIKQMDSTELLERITALNADYQVLPVAAVELLKPRCHTLVEMMEKTVYFVTAPTSYDEQAIAKFVDEATYQHLTKILAELEQSEWQSDVISGLIKKYTKDNALKFPAIAQPLRIALSGNVETPSINDVLAIFEKNEAISRIKKFIAKKD